MAFIEVIHRHMGQEVAMYMYMECSPIFCHFMREEVNIVVFISKKCLNVHLFLNAIQHARLIKQKTCIIEEQA